MSEGPRHELLPIPPVAFLAKLDSLDDKLHKYAKRLLRKLAEQSGKSLSEMNDEALSYTLSCRTQATWRAYSSRWLVFSEWCDVHCIDPVNASTEAAIRHLGELGKQKCAIRTLRQSAACITFCYRLMGKLSPLSTTNAKNPLDGIFRRHRKRPSKAVPFTPNHIRQMIEASRRDVVGLRDRALICFAFASGMRSNELSRMELSWLNFDEAGGIGVYVPDAKEDQYGEGHERYVCAGEHERTCPVRTLRAWIKYAPVKSGFVFRPCTKAGTVSNKQLSTRQIQDVVRGLARVALGDAVPYSSHSLRSGCCTALHEKGVIREDIQHHVGHKKPETTDMYIKRSEDRRKAVTKDMGL